MGFQYARILEAAPDTGAGNCGDPKTSRDGTYTIALPYVPRVGLYDSNDLRNEVSALNVQRFRREDNGLDVVTGVRGQVPFVLVPGTGVRVRVNETRTVELFGTHHPEVTVDFIAANDGSSGLPVSLDGTNEFAPPYHTTADTALDLMNELGAENVINVQRFRTCDNGFDVFSATRGQVPFAIEPTKSYRVRVRNHVLDHIPSHY